VDTYDLRGNTNIQCGVHRAFTNGQLNNYFQAQAVVPGLLFYWAGEKVFRQLNTLRSIEIKSLLVASLFTLLVASQANRGCPTNPFNKCTGFYDEFAVLFIFGQYGFLPLFLVSAFAGIAAVTNIALLIAVNPNRIGARLFAYLGEKSIDLLILNAIFFTYMQPTLKGILPKNFGIFNTLFIALILTFCHVLVLPSSSKVTGFIASKSKTLSFWCVDLYRLARKKVISR
jgi:hypothetical protein